MGTRLLSDLTSIALLVPFLVPASSAAGQAEPTVERGVEARTLRQVLTGRVHQLDGSRAQGALVVSSAGGRAVTGADGSFELALDVPLAAESVELIAVASARAGGASLAASASVTLPSLSSSIQVGALVLAQHPSRGWQPTFGYRPDLYGPTFDLEVFDDGSGPELYAGGDFSEVGGVAADNIAKWDGTRWSALESEPNGYVFSLAVFDEGGGPALYVGGRFTNAGGVAASSIAKWDGSSWSPLGSGVSGSFGDVLALAVFDDGGGPALYAGGDFTTAGGVAASSIAKWDGSSWSPLGSGMNDPATALAVFDDGGGPALYAGGEFTTAGGVAASRIAKWDGSGWSPLGGGTDGYVTGLVAFDDGSGTALYAGGGFTSAGGLAANRIARWDGSSWSALGSGFPGVENVHVDCLTTFDDGGGAALYAGGWFTNAGGVTANRIAKWNGSIWAALGTGLSGLMVSALAVFDDGTGPALFASTVDLHARHVAKWDGSSWSLTNKGLDDQVDALVVLDEGSGPELYAGGTFTRAGDQPANHVARWSGSGWSALGDGFDVPVRALTVFDDGSGPAVHAGGGTSVWGGSEGRIAQWDGSAWSDLGAINGFVRALAVFDDGNGAALYAGGDFASAGGVAASRIARWDGSSWSALGSGITGATTRFVDALVVFDDGTGPALVVGGRFTRAGSGVFASQIAKWDGTAWSALGSGLNNTVDALAVFDDGGGPALYAGGIFTTAGGVPASRIARWDGTSWSSLGSGLDSGVSALTVFDDLGGPALYAGGTFDVAGGVAASSIAKWDGTSWSALQTGLTGGVGALAVFAGGNATALVAGGAFRTSSAGDSYVASWRCTGKTRRMMR